MVVLFLHDVEEAFGIGMGKYRQQLWSLEDSFDKVCLPALNTWRTPTPCTFHAVRC